ncbi:MAG: Fe-S cluster assembly protein SufD [Cyclobacteriaceae bacterium]|nr:Fe-S cluster assembly protein SufD [Cyclobacteriaceae bacterium]
MSVVTETTPLLSDILADLKSEAGLRTAAHEALEQLGLPGNKSEEYKFTPITRALEKNFQLAKKNPSSEIESIDSFSIPGIDANSIVFVNGVFAEKLSHYEQTDVFIKSISGTENGFGTLADFKTDPFVAWNTAAWSTGISIEVKANTSVSKPIVLHYVHDSAAGEVKSFIRNIIRIGKSSSVTVIEKQDTLGDQAGFSNIVTEGFVEENAELSLFSLQADKGKRFHFGQTTIWQARDSRVNSFTLTLDGKLIRNNFLLVLDGEGIESHMDGLYILQGDTLADNHTVVDHRKPHSNSNELYKGIIDDNAKGVFNGKIYVRPDAQKTNAFQSNRNILLSDKSTVNTKPQLEIWADDVKCSHGCTTGQLDDEAMFYLQARGIDKVTARAMMLYAFAGEVLDKINSEPLKKYFDTLISERLHKNF